MIIEYQASVMVPAGWRAVTIQARAKQISPKMVEVTEVITIDGELPLGYTSRTGAKRQQYNARGISLREVAKKKRLSSCTVLQEAEA